MDQKTQAFLTEPPKKNSDFFSVSAFRIFIGAVVLMDQKTQAFLTEPPKKNSDFFSVSALHNCINKPAYSHGVPCPVTYQQSWVAFDC